MATIAMMLRALTILILATIAVQAEESAYRREDVEQVGEYVPLPFPDPPKPRAKNDSIIRPGGKLLIMQMTHGEFLARIRRSDARVGYWLEW
jgi:hypothetical protein